MLVNKTTEGWAGTFWRQGVCLGGLGTAEPGQEGAGGWGQAGDEDLVFDLLHFVSFDINEM